MIINKRKNLTEADLDLTVWRYFTFPKFISLLTYQALWFSKLNILQDQCEGTLPTPAKIKMHEENQEWKRVFTQPEHHCQLDEMPDRNVEDGRVLMVVNCWFLGEHESQQMWSEYVGNSEGVAIKSTIRKLCSHVFVYPEFSHIGKVNYIDFNEYDMNLYEANQAPERAFLKDKSKYSHEQEVRLVTMSLKTPMCVNMAGKPLQVQEYTGACMNNFENLGLYIRADLRNLIDAIILAPLATEWFEMLIRRISELANFKAIVERSQIENG